MQRGVMTETNPVSATPADFQMRQIPTLLGGQLAIRAAIVNHRTDTCDLDALVAAVIRFGTARTRIEPAFRTFPNGRKKCKMLPPA